LFIIKIKLKIKIYNKFIGKEKKLFKELTPGVLFSVGFYFFHQSIYYVEKYKKID